MAYDADDWELDNPCGEDDPLLSSLIPDDPIPPVAAVEFLNLHENMCFDKVQTRKGGTPKQVLENAVIKMKATYGPEQLLNIRGWIRREPEAAKLCNDMNHEVPLYESLGKELNLAKKCERPIVADDPRYMAQLFSVDLGKVYEGPHQPVFQLAKTDTLQRNRFQLLIQLVFLHRDPSAKFISPTFICRTKPKRPRPEEGHSTGTQEPPQSKICRPETVGSPDNGYRSVESTAPPAPSTLNLIVDSLNAKTAIIEDLVANNVRIEAKHADIAYHLRIEDPEICAELEEGDIVGFYTNENDGGTYIKPLRSEDIESAVHAGVVSRSHYLAANKPSVNECATDTVCVIGIVNVKVVGSVENGERIYASVDRPGKAIPQSHLPVGSFLRKKHVLLGMALERKFPKSFEDSHLVKCFVCIILDVNRTEILEEVERLYEANEKSTQEQIKISSKKTWTKLHICFLTLLFLVGLLAFLLYQVLVPGSMFRYWLCRRGSISGHNVNFDFVPFRDRTTEYHAHGIQFSFWKLRQKISDNFNENRRNDTGGTAYYYLNLDRCAYGWDYGPVGNNVGGHKRIAGGTILSVNSRCTSVYYYGYNGTRRGMFWTPYISSRNLICDPRPPFD